MRYQISRGIILRKSIRGEKDYLLTIYTQTRGKIHAWAKGSQQFLSKRRATFEIGNICEFQFYTKGDTTIVTESILQKNNSIIKSSIDGILNMMTLLEMVDKLTDFEYRYDQHYKLVEETLLELDKKIDQKNGGSSALALTYFILKHLTLFGLINNITECSKCHNTVNRGKNTPYHLIDVTGSIECFNCYLLSGKVKATEINATELKTLGLLQHAKDLSHVEAKNHSEQAEKKYGELNVSDRFRPFSTVLSKDTDEKLLKIGSMLIEPHLYSPLKTTSIIGDLIIEQKSNSPPQ